MTWYESGRVEGRFNHKGGRIEGPGTIWYENGNKRQECEFRDGKSHGLVTLWRANGTIAAKLLYNNGEQQEQTDYDESGTKRCQATYRGGLLHGVRYIWDEKGTKRGQATYGDGKIQGTISIWDANGKNRHDIRCENGLPKEMIPSLKGSEMQKWVELFTHPHRKQDSGSALYRLNWPPPIDGVDVWGLPHLR